ncbi:methylmalonyl-CoA epimerase [Tsukamurella soli]|uniref:Methylmalonyl-CoA epimerase n=1 Tax=Tsukamurella soli TaxID=644556 RepID=A0ABP8J942_9ACTN
MSTHEPHSEGRPAPTPAHPVPGELVLGVDHVGIAVADLDAAIAFYAETFGMVCTHEEVNEAQGVREAMLSPASLAGTPDGAGSSAGFAAQIQLLAPLSSESTIAKFLDRNGPGMQQLAYRVTDVVAVAEHLRSRGVRLLYDAPRGGTAGSLINFVHPKDAGGILVELVQPAQ